MRPHSIEVLHLYRHMFVTLDHVPPFVLVRTSEEHHLKLKHQIVKVGDLTYVLDIEYIDLIVAEDCLIEVADYLFENFPSSDFIVDRDQRLGHDCWFV
jgi:hypothetical protein